MGNNNFGPSIVSLTGRDNHKQGDDDSVVSQIGELEA